MGVFTRLPLYGGVLAVTSISQVTALDVEILIPLYEFPSTNPDSMWASLKTAAQNGHSITGIMNPFNGPNTDTGSENAYLSILHNFLNKGEGADHSNTDIPPKIICYVYTRYGDETPGSGRPREEVEADIRAYETIYPGVCDGIFFDEAASDTLTDSSGELTSIGELFKHYNNFVVSENKTATFNSGTGTDYVYYNWDGFYPQDPPGSHEVLPTVSSYETYYSNLKKVGVPRPPANISSSQNAMLVHTAAELASDESLIKPIVEKAACSGWGKLYLTDSTFAENPWNEPPSFWNTLVTEVSQDITLTCPDDPGSRMRLMIPVLPNPVPDAAGLDALMQPLVDSTIGALSESDFGDVVSVVLDARNSDMMNKAAELRDAGARILCYMDAAGDEETNRLSAELTGAYSTAADEVCGGFYVDNLNTAVITQGDIRDFYANTQYKVPRSTVVFNPVPDPVANDFLYTTDWSQISYSNGRVIVVTMVDGATSETIPSAAGDRPNSAVIMTAFPEGGSPLQCPITDMAAASYGYVYVTEASDFTTLSSYFATLVTETESPSPPPTCICSGEHTSPSPVDDPLTCTPTFNPTLTPTPAPSPTPPPMTGVMPACGSEPSPTIAYVSSSRTIRITDGGCADMSRILAHLTARSISDVLIDVGSGIWELDATIDIRDGSTLKIAGQGLGECNELRIITSSTRNRVLGQGGSIIIQSTEIYGWNNGMVDQSVTNQRAYILCKGCRGVATDQCIMSVTDSMIGYLGSGGVSTSGLAWRNECATQGVASVQSVFITGNRRGIYVKGVDVDFDGVMVNGSEVEGMRVDTCSGHISTSIVDQPGSTWGMNVQRSDGFLVADNTLTGTRGISLANADDVVVCGNQVQPSSTAIRVRTTNTQYEGNVGDGMYSSSSRVGVLASRGGCFTQNSTSEDPAVQDYIDGQVCL